jgi:ethanolamine utilization protein EutQ (cupin superfamily)
MLRTLLALAAIAAVAVAGCASQSTSSDSSGKFRGEQRLVANTIEDFESAASKGDQDQICRELLAQPLILRYTEHGGSCEHAVDAALKDTDSFGLTVESVRISDTDATARVKADRGKKDVIRTINLVKEGPGWRISEFVTG